MRGLARRRRMLAMGLLGGGGGIKYLLRDEFTTPLAAGSVNGTAAEPGPGARVVSDANLRLSLSGGEVVLSGDGIGWGDPGIRYAGISRSAGKIMIFDWRFTSGSFNNYAGFSWTTASGALDMCHPAISLNSATSYTFRFSSTSGLVVRDYIVVHAATPTVNAFVLRTPGAFYFAKVNGTWLLCGIDTIGSNATVYPLMVSCHVAGVYRSSFMRIPDKSWLPTPLAYDTFNRADGAIGSTLATGPDDQTTPVLSWNNRAGTVAINTNVAICTVLAGGLGISTVPSASANVMASVALTRGTATAGLVLRYVDADNYLYVVHNGTNLTLVSREGGIETTLINAAATYGVGKVIRALVYGTTCSVYYDEKQIGTSQVVPASASGNHGLYYTDTDSTLDNFNIWARGTNNEYSELDRY